jgi:predicted RND superfamily exporter protein
MKAESSRRKDTLKTEKLSLLVLSLCIVVLACLLVFRPF